MTAPWEVCQDGGMTNEQREYETLKLAERLYNKWRPDLFHETWVGLKKPVKAKWYEIAQLAWDEVLMAHGEVGE